MDSVTRAVQMAIFIYSTLHVAPMAMASLFTSALPGARRRHITIAIVGIGYVGLPLAIAFAKAGFPVIGYDKDRQRISELLQGKDTALAFTRKQVLGAKARFTYDPSLIREADVVIVAVPTPIDKRKQPDLSPIRTASSLVGRHLKKGAVVVFESTVYPGITEEVCLPIIEKSSGLSCPKDFTVGYSPERINPGDKQHTLENIVKIVAGIDRKTLLFLSGLYASIVRAGVFPAKSMKVAEAAKLIENTQRDLNIGLMNELSLIFDRMHIRTKDVLDAACTKWNFHCYVPGLVGGHCISVDPHYLLHKAQMLGYRPKVILAGRGINDIMPGRVAAKTVDMLRAQGKNPKKCTVVVLGLTFKENLKDIRNSKALDVIQALRSKVREVEAYDPLLEPATVRDVFRVQCRDIKKRGFRHVDALIITVVHDAFRRIDFSKAAKEMHRQPVLFDVKSFFSEEKLKSVGFAYDAL